MSFKVLVADDSSNIQKVVNIIYEDRDIEITPCLDPAELDSLASQGYDLILLDFSFDNEVEGYDLIGKLKSYNSKVVLLFGTFDSIDEEKVTESGADGFLFKPFDSDKLLGITDELLGASSGGAGDLSDLKDIPDVIDDTPITETSSPVDEVGDETAWGIKIPGVIGEGEDTEDLDSFTLNEDNQRIPEIIEGDLTKTIVGGINSLEIDEEDEPQTVYPSEEDLEYPDIIEGPTAEEIKAEASSSKLIPSNELLIEDSDEEMELTTDSTEIVEMDMDPEQEKENLKQLKQQIFEELDEDLWSEEHTNTNILMGELGKGVVEQNQKVTAVHSKKDLLEGLKADFYTEIRNEVLEGLRNDLPELLKDELLPYFEEHIKAYCREAVERGMWEILPDLAEKVVMKELEEIRKTID